jgi:putative ABC transport system permease protein
MVLLDGVRMIAISVVIGVVIAVGISRFLGALLFGLDARDPINILAAATLFAFMAMAICALPAHRAGSIDPANALQAE